MNEFEIIKNFFSKLSLNNKSSLFLNDDVFFDKSKKMIVSVDTYVDGIHFINFKKPELVIKKIIRSSISDIICKGVKPKYYFISGSGNTKTFSKKNLRKISKSLKEEQKKYKIQLCGGDTTKSKVVSFTIVSLGFSNKIVYRNKAKLHDDIYVTGNLGDSYMGLKVLKKKINLNRKLKDYFEKRYYPPDLQINFTNKLLNFANSSIDISDGLFADLKKLINKQKLSFKLYLNQIPISKNLKNLIFSKRLKKISFISRGDDYQILFTASPFKSRIINKTAKSLGVKITKIGKICNYSTKSQILDEKLMKIDPKHQGYSHRF